MPFRIIDVGQEWRDFADSGDPSRSRVNKVDQHITELSTDIGQNKFKHGDFQSYNSANSKLSNAQRRIAVKDHCASSVNPHATNAR
jgi:hypothetical protein